MTMLMVLVGGISLSRGETVNITEHGAVGDGTTLNTVAIQGAIDRCHAQGLSLIHI